MSGATLRTVKPTVRVTREDGASSRYVLEEERDDGSLVLSPDTSYEAILERAPGRPLTEEEFEELFGDLPRDGEG